MNYFLYKNRWLAQLIVFVGVTYVVSAVFGMDSIISLLSGVLALTLVELFYSKVFLSDEHLKKPDSKKAVPNLSRDKKNYYLSFGLTDKDISFFRETLSQAKKEIKQISKLSKENRKIEAILLRRRTITTMQHYFKSLVSQPDKLFMAGNFLYRDLKKLLEIILNYLALQNSANKDKETLAVLSDAEAAIDEVCQSIEDDYHKFLSDTKESLNQTINEKPIDLTDLTSMETPVEVNSKATTETKYYNLEELNDDFFSDENY